MQGLLECLLPLGTHGYIIGNGEKPITLTQFKNMFSRLKKKLPLNDATTHSFRHTMGTLLNATGANVKTIQSMLGHSDYKTTMDRYVHAVDSNQQEAAKKVDQILRNRV